MGSWSTALLWKSQTYFSWTAVRWRRGCRRTSQMTKVSFTQREGKFSFKVPYNCIFLAFISYYKERHRKVLEVPDSWRVQWSRWSKWTYRTEAVMGIREYLVVNLYSSILLAVMFVGLNAWMPSWSDWTQGFQKRIPFPLFEKWENLQNYKPPLIDAPVWAVK